MRKTAIFLIVLLTIGLISPSLSLAASEKAEPHAINQQAEDMGEEQDEVSVEPSEEDLLAHIREESVKVYQDLNDLSVSEEAGSAYMNKVYYIENQAKIEDQLYYLINSEIDDENAEVGWVESENVITQSYHTVDEQEETLFISGSGEAYQKPWGGEEDIVYDLVSFENEGFEIDLTQKVGEDIWYRGILDNETVWIQSNHLKTEEASNDSKDNENTESEKQVGDDDDANEPEKSEEVTDEEQQNDKNTEDEIEKEHQDDGQLEEDEADANHTTSEKASLKRSIASKVQEGKTSKLGHIRSTNVDIYKNINDLSSSKKAGDKYTHAVYYIKKQAALNGQVYYLLSTEPSSTKGVVGWVKSQDLSTHSHVGVDKKSKTFYIKGTGKAYDTAWGGNKNLVYNLSKYNNQVFKVHLTEKVGNNTWYRGTLNGKTVWIHESYLGSVKESKTSKLGHIRSAKVQIYKTIGDASTVITAGDKYTHAVYYIKKQAKVNSQVYYLISKSPSSTKSVVGWVKSQDLSIHSHVGVDKKSKTFYIKGTGNAYDTAWGGKKNLVYKLSQYKGQAFKVHLTEKVGNNTWYRGTLNGKTVWMHSSYVTSKIESKTSKLGHIRSANVKIYNNIGDASTAITAGDKYTHAVYYIKKQAKVNNQVYYLISKSPSSTKGVVGWVKSQDLSTHPHVGVDKKAKTFYVKGTGKAYDTAWGGNKNLVYDLPQYKGQVFKVHLTEKVGNNTWYRGVLNGQTVWIHTAYLVPPKQVDETHTNYNLTLDRMVDIQMAVTPQTDKRYQLWIREDAFKKGSISNGKGTIQGNNWNLRRGPGTGYSAGGKVNNGTVLSLKSSKKGSDGYTWYYVRDTSGWVIPDREDVEYYLNPSKFLNDLKGSLQFLKLSQTAGIDVAEVNDKILKGKGILAGKAQSFIDGAETYGVNEIYLISHALLETGNGTSKLATGVKYKGKTVYNMYGIGARDNCPLECGSKYAYEAGWFTPEAAIKGGAAFVGNNYLGVGQDTLYKMRWNPAFAAKNGYASHQYATDIGWASKQTTRMYELYNLLDGYNLSLDIPKYK